MGLEPIFYLRKTVMDLRQLLETTLPGLGYEFVELELTRNGGVRVFIDKPEGINVDDCVAVSNHLTRVFAVEDIDYDRLEVSSPGMDRPLTRPADFQRFLGESAKMKTRLPINGQRQFVGVMKSLEAGVLVLELADPIRLVEIPLGQIERARLVPQYD
jgi:ribosome maturation factor RimP